MLAIRNKAEAKKKENELKAKAEEEGRPVEDIKVKPGEVDWLFGDQKEAEKFKDTSSEVGHLFLNIKAKCS